MSALQSHNYRRPAANSKPVLQIANFAIGKQAHPMISVALIVIVGFLGIALLNLGLFVVTSGNQYHLANLKNERDKVVENTQILQQQVDSLSSNQNLSNAAQALGMISNSTPVYLNVESQTTIGKPKVALADTASRVSGNLVSNLAMNTKTNVAKLRAALAKQEREATRAVHNAAVKSSTLQAGQTTKSGSIPSVDFRAAAGNGNVANQQTTTAKVSSLQGQIPTSPTH